MCLPIHGELGGGRKNKKASGSFQEMKLDMSPRKYSLRLIEELRAWCHWKKIANQDAELVADIGKLLDRIEKLEAVATAARELSSALNIWRSGGRVQESQQALDKALSAMDLAALDDAEAGNGR